MGNSEFEKTSRGAFDVDAVNHGSGWTDDIANFATESFDTGLKGIFARLGLNDQIISKLGSVGSSDFVDNLLGAGADIISAGIQSVLGDGLSLLFDAGRVGFDLFTKSGSKRDFNFTQGEWVIIDNGPVKVDPSGFQVSELRPPRRFAWKPPTDKDELRRRAAETGLQLEGERDVVAGFYISKGKQENFVTVFDFALFRDRDVLITSVNGMAESEAKKLDKNELATEIRKLKFLQAECSRINATVPTDPGTEVLLDDVRYHVVTSIGQNVTVEDEWGQQKVVDISLLKRGRTQHTEVFNYKSDGTVTGNFVGSGEDSIYSGRWLWVSARELGYPAARELVCVQYIHNKVHVFYALDGSKGSFTEDEVELVSDEFCALIGANKAFTEFRGFAMAGYDMHRVSLGKTYPLVCVGVTGTDNELIKTPMKEVEACDTVFSRLEKAIARVGDLDLHKELDYAEEAGRKDQTRNQDAFDIIGEELGEPDNGSDGSYGAIMMAGVGLVALLLINSVG